MWQVSISELGAAPQREGSRSGGRWQELCWGPGSLRLTADAMGCWGQSPTLQPRLAQPLCWKGDGRNGEGVPESPHYTGLGSQTP